MADDEIVLPRTAAKPGWNRLEALAAVLKGQSVVGPLENAFEIVRSRPHGHVAAVLGTVARLQLAPLLARARRRERDLCLAMIAARLIAPSSKLALARGLAADTAESTLGERLGVAAATEDDCYAAMDWVLARQETIEAALAKRHLADGALVLYDVTSTYFEDLGPAYALATRPLARRRAPLVAFLDARA